MVKLDGDVFVGFFFILRNVSGKSQNSKIRLRWKTLEIHSSLHLHVMDIAHYFFRLESGGERTYSFTDGGFTSSNRVHFCWISLRSGSHSFSNCLFSWKKLKILLICVGTWCSPLMIHKNVFRRQKFWWLVEGKKLFCDEFAFSHQQRNRIFLTSLVIRIGD